MRLFVYSARGLTPNRTCNFAALPDNVAYTFLGHIFRIPGLGPDLSRF
jgi:hypothetical protein